MELDGLTNIFSMSSFDKITTWFVDCSKRDSLKNSFNAYAQRAYTELSMPTLFTMTFVSGDSSYWHEHSSLLRRTGICISAVLGKTLSKNDALYIGSCVLLNNSIMRRLYLLGFDTFYVQNINNVAIKWAVKDFV